MITKRIARASTLALAGAALAGAFTLTGAGSASAASGGGCGGNGGQQACISVDGSTLISDAYTNFANSNCTIDLVLFDQTTGYRWDTMAGCGLGWTHYAGTTVPDPTPGHVYQTELIVNWGAGNIGVTWSPTLTA
ncbi:hypothetical protein ACGF12_07890 [Kitasatospora sp. NPDC048296]|uniref:hypothetical protein n=1 Tax=Kitasatospora sp. NPDC048296 TaxID=3364048 RepID=UPI00371D693C